MSVVILAAVAVAFFGGCGTDTEFSTPTTSAAVDFPYPPFEIRTDIAVPLPPRLRDAAQFALDMSVNDRRKTIPTTTKLTDGSEARSRRRPTSRTFRQAPILLSERRGARFTVRWVLGVYPMTRSK